MDYPCGALLPTATPSTSAPPQRIHWQSTVTTLGEATSTYATCLRHDGESSGEVVDYDCSASCQFAE
eukprot:2534155-Pyramimonas_sp.AAC.1